MNELLATVWIMSYVGLPILLVISVIITGFISKKYIKKAYLSVKTIALIHLVTTSVVTWVIRDGLLGPKSTGIDAFIYFIKPMSIFLMLILGSMLIAHFIYTKRNNKGTSNQRLEPTANTPVDPVDEQGTDTAHP